MAEALCIDVPTIVSPVILRFATVGEREQPMAICNLSSARRGGWSMLPEEMRACMRECRMIIMIMLSGNGSGHSGLGLFCLYRVRYCRKGREYTQPRGIHPM